MENCHVNIHKQYTPNCLLFTNSALLKKLKLYQTIHTPMRDLDYAKLKQTEHRILLKWMFYFCSIEIFVQLLNFRGEICLKDRLVRRVCVLKKYNCIMSMYHFSNPICTFINVRSCLYICFWMYIHPILINVATTKLWWIMFWYLTKNYTKRLGML